MLKVKRSLAVKLFYQMGYQLAKKWSNEKLTEKLNAIETEPDEPFEREELDKLMDDLMDSEEAVVVPDDEEKERKEMATKTKRRPKGRTKPKAQTRTSRTKPKFKKPKPKAKKEKAPTIDDLTFECIQGKGMSLKAIVGVLMKKFAHKDRFDDEEHVTKMTRRRLTGHIQTKYGVKIVKSDRGIYSVA